MIILTLAGLAEVVGGRVVGGAPDTVVSGPAFVDSRAVEPGGLFVAVAGERVDGHDYAAAAVAAGAAGVLGSREAGVPGVVVDDVVAALGVLAAHVRRNLAQLTVVGVTGSQGKTSTKDLLTDLLAPLGPTVAATGSQNNEIGLPLTVLRATTEDRFLVCEMGARGKGHIAFLADIAAPQVGAVLNVGVAHLGEFGSRDAIAVAKGELVEALPADGLAVLNADDDRVAPMVSRTAAATMTFGRTAGADVRLTDESLNRDGCPEFRLGWRGGSEPVSMQYVGAHHAMNAAAAAAVAFGLGMSLAEVAATLSGARPRSHWRMEVSTTPAGIVVVNDAYNANPDSMRAALEATAAIAAGRGGARTVAVLGEMRELGAAAADEHRSIGAFAAASGIDRVVVVGDSARAIVDGANEADPDDRRARFAADADQALVLLRDILRPGDVVLVKASRATGLERLASALATDDGTGPTR